MTWKIERELIQNPEIEIQNLRSEKLKQRNKRIEDMKNNKSWNAIHLSPWFTGLLLGSQRSCQVAHGRSFVWPDGSLPRDLKVIHMESTDLHLQSCRDPDSDFIHLLNVDESSSVIWCKPWIPVVSWHASNPTNIERENACQTTTVNHGKGMEELRRMKPY